MNHSTIPVVILCGGEGTRLREETHDRPKPLIEIGPEPILVHIMQLYSSHGFRRFILCLGYRGMMIKQFFLDRELRTHDLRLEMSTGTRSFLKNQPEMDWEIVFAETGGNNQTGSRIKQIARYVETPTFMVTYGDGLANIDLQRLFAFHLSHGAIGTVTGVAVKSQFGELRVEGNTVRSFSEKPTNQTLINGGFFVLNRKFLDYLSVEPDCVLEGDPLERLAREGQLKMFFHQGFWRCMDTFKDYKELNDLCVSGIAPWLEAREGCAHESAA
jgi:glucose-1-phosphate cytidylyltransferase